MSFSSDDVDPSIASFFDETESVPSMGSETSSAFSMMSGSNQKDFSEFVAEKTSGKGSLGALGNQCRRQTHDDCRFHDGQ